MNTSLNNRILKSVVLKSYFASIILVGLPPFYFLFSYLNTHSIAKLIWLILLVAFGFGWLKRRKIDIKNALGIFFLVFFISQSISVVNVFDVKAFLGVYEDFLFASFFFLLSFLAIKDAKSFAGVLKCLFFIGFINIILQILLLINAQAFLKIGEFFIHSGYLDHISINIERKRLYLEIYDEALIPILFYLTISGVSRFGSSFFIVLLSIFSFISGFRTRFLMFIVGIIASFGVFLKLFKRYFLVVVLLMLVFPYLYSSVSLSRGFTVLDRIFLEDKREDVLTVTGRIRAWKKSVEIGKAFPLFGAGLGNYFDYLDFTAKQTYSLFERQKKEFELAVVDPHGVFFRIFAETGFFGLFSFLALLGYFWFKDFELIKKGSGLEKAFVISFWVLFTHSIFNPSTTVKYQMYFWLFRVLIERAEKFSRKKAIIQSLRLQNP